MYCNLTQTCIWSVTLQRSPDAASLFALFGQVDWKRWQDSDDEEEGKSNQWNLDGAPASVASQVRRNAGWTLQRGHISIRFRKDGSNHPVVYLRSDFPVFPVGFSGLEFKDMARSSLNPWGYWTQWISG